MNTVLPNFLTDKGMVPTVANGVAWLQNVLPSHRGGLELRQGWGLMTRADVSLTAGKLDGEDNGITRVLGIKTLTTGQGDQVLALTRTTGWGGDEFGTLTNTYVTVFSLLVYDVPTDALGEYILHRHTGEEPTDTWRAHGHYDAHTTSYRQRWVDAGAGDLIGYRNPVDLEPCFITDPITVEGTVSVVLFGTSRVGAWTYSPTLPRHARRQVNTALPVDSRPPESEDHVVVPLIPKASTSVEDGYTYLTAQELGKPQAAAVVGNRVAYAVGNLVYWSDPSDPASIVDVNVDNYPGNIVALSSVLGVLYVHLADSTYVCYPARGFIVSGGDIRLASADAGCLAPLAATSHGNLAVILHRSGVYALTGGPQVEKLSEAIDPFFHSDVGLSTPWTGLGGLEPGANAPPPSHYRWTEQNAAGAHVTIDDEGRIYVTFPVLALTLLYAGGWYAWTTGTIVNNEEVLDWTNTLPLLHVAAAGQRLFAVSGPTVVDEVTAEANPTNRSIAFLELGRGGNLDRSSGGLEDRRWNAGEFVTAAINVQTPTSRDARYFLTGPLEPIEEGWVPPWAPGTTIGANDFWVPIDLIVGDAVADVGTSNVVRFSLYLDFDNTEWEPIINAVALNPYEALFDLPTERLDASPAYSLGAADHATPQGVYVYDTGTALPDPAGDQLRIIVSATFGGAWSSWPQFGFLPRARNPLLKVAFRRKSPVVTDVLSLDMTPTLATLQDSLAANYTAGVKVWRAAPINQLPGIHESNDGEAQAVDWMIHSDRLVSDGSQMLARGAIVKVASTGQSTGNVIGANWPEGLLNLAMSASDKDLAPQLVDAGGSLTGPLGLPPGYTSVPIDPVAPRYGNPVLPPVFNGGPTWGDAADPDVGTATVADTAVDNLAGSSRMKGDSIRLALYGHVRDAGEAVNLHGANAVIRDAGGKPRRRGRS